MTFGELRKVVHSLDIIRVYINKYDEAAVGLERSISHELDSSKVILIQARDARFIDVYLEEK